MKSMETPKSSIAFRVTFPLEELTTVWDRIEEACDRFVLVQHKADVNVSRTHVHGYAVGLRVSIPTIKNWIFDIKLRKIERNEWSFKSSYKNPITKQVCDIDEKVIVYMLKGHLWPHIHKGYTADQITEFQRLWVGKRQIQTDLLDQESDGKVTHYQMMKQIETKLSLYTRDVTKEDVIREIIHNHRLNHKMISRYKIRDFVDTYYARNEPDSFVQQILILCQKV